MLQKVLTHSYGICHNAGHSFAGLCRHPGYFGYSGYSVLQVLSRYPTAPRPNFFDSVSMSLPSRRKFGDRDKWSSCFTPEISTFVGAGLSTRLCVLSVAS